MNLYRRLLKLVKPHWPRLAIAMVCMVLTALFTAALPYLIKPVIDDIFVNKKEEMLKFLSIAVLLVFAGKGLSDWGQAYFMSYVGQRIIVQLRQQLYDHLQRLPLSFFDGMPTGLLMSRVTNDVNLIQGAVSNAVTGILKDPLTIVGLIAVMFHRDWQLAAVAMVVLPFAFFPVVKFGRMLRRISTKSQQSMGDISIILHETLGGSRIVKAFGMEEYEKERFSRENTRYFKYLMKSVMIRALSSPLMEFIGGVAIAFIILYGGHRVIRGVSSPGEFFSFLGALLMLYEPVKRLSKVNNVMQEGLAEAHRIYDILDTPPGIEDKPHAVQLQPMERELDFRNVEFGYDSEPVLKNINLRVTAGEVVAIVGISGAGKSTLVDLIPRFYEVTGGAILIDGVDIRDVTVSSLRAQIALVTQETILFNDTVRNNIGYGDIRKSKQEIIAAAKAANAYDFVMRMPEGFETIIGEQGVRLSGGERQRICIARALLKNAPILILDEATSSLDSETEMEVQKALENLMAGRTTLVIAHRLSTIQNANRIIVMADGQIVQQGRHDELMRWDSEYRRLYDMQFSHVDNTAAAKKDRVASGRGGE
jgi:subfamily B ATP-binding cassette protein MsbA